MLDWLIVGGGVQGSYLSNVVVHALGAAPERVRVLDPRAGPLEAWRQRARNCAMDFLRSPGVHHIDVDPFSLLRYARSEAAPPTAELWGRYQHPSLCLFEAHARAVIERAGLEALRTPGELRHLRACDGGYRADTTHGELRARRVVLAVGPPRELNWPAWARAARERGAPIAHLFDEDAPLAGLATHERVLVVGSGCTAAHAALHSARRARSTTWLTRTALRGAEYDSEPGWLGPKFLRTFERERAPVQRRATIDAARQPGTLPERLQHAVALALRHGRLVHELGDEPRIELDEHGHAHVRGVGTAREHVFERIVLATGFARVRPGDGWIDALADELGLERAPCGYPVLAPTLEWAPGLYVTGQLAELELGPTARNIGGARLAAERLVLGRSAA